MAPVEFSATRSCVCPHTWTREWDDEKDKFIPSKWLESQRPSRVSRIGLAGNQSSFQCPRKTSADLHWKKRSRNDRRGRQREWPRFKEVGASKFNPFLCAWYQSNITSSHPWKKTREQMVSFLWPYWWITVSDVKSQSHTIISMCHLFHCCGKLKHSRLLLNDNLLPRTWAPVWGTSMWQQRHLVVICNTTRLNAARQASRAHKPVQPKSLGLSAPWWHRSEQQRWPKAGYSYDANWRALGERRPPPKMIKSFRKMPLSIYYI